MRSSFKILLFCTTSVISSSFQHRNRLKGFHLFRSMSNFVTQSEVAAVENIQTVLPTGFVDVHAHLIHEKFKGEEDFIVAKCETYGLEYIVVNGLDPPSNRDVLNLCAQHRCLLPAIGIYPLDAACNVIQPATWKHEFPPPSIFDVDAEIDFIEEMAKSKEIVALGECGLDKHYLTDAVSLEEQERVLRKLMKVAVKYDLPIILHSRKAEERVFQMLQEENVIKADFHCFCGKAKLGKRIAEAGYYLSIPSAVERTDSFKKLVKELPLDKILTETDCPYLGPDKGERNDPSTVPRGVTAIALAKGLEESFVKEAIRNNFRTLFGL